MPDASAVTLVFLHSLGASRREWAPLIEFIGDQRACVTLDLPGFGDAAAAGDVPLREVVQEVSSRISKLGLGSWVLVGHSMGGKIATLVADQARQGAPGLAGLCGVVLVAASSLSPEPMDEARREEMLGWFQDPDHLRAEAKTFIAANTVSGLEPDREATAITDFSATSPAAWRGWLERGSREDWSHAVEVLETPALVIAGAEDGDLGEAAQRSLNLPRYRNAAFSLIDGAAHMIPLEQPEALGRLILDFSGRIASTALPEDFVRLLSSDRVSTATRSTLLKRHAGPDNDAPGFLTPRHRHCLQSLIGRILPGEDRVDIALRLEANLAGGRGDGWRFASLPPDPEAWRRGLETLLICRPAFPGLSAQGQDEALLDIEAGRLGADGPVHLVPAQMRLWFQDVRAEAARCWMSLPRNWAEIGYDGFATGGDDRAQGYDTVAGDAREPWRLSPEPRA